MARAHKQRQEPDTDDAACAGQEYPH
jgi:hypothetical protein